MYAQQKIEQIPDIDYFIFGHRHLPIDFLLRNGHSRYLNLGEWLYHNSYVVAEQGQVQHLFFENEQGRIFGRQAV
jgi:UDP-2,3-diacylglucosamine hydrolase